MQQDAVCYAGLWPRFLALAIDFALFAAIFTPVTRLVKGVWIMSASDHAWVRGLWITDPLCLAFFAIMIGYFWLLEGCLGTTLGKWIVGLRVIRAQDGTRPGLGRSAMRTLLRAVDGLPALNLLGIVLISRSVERARLGDRIAGTRVIHVR